MEVICLEDEALYVLIETVVKRIKEKENVKQDKWISTEEAMSKLLLSTQIDQTDLIDYSNFGKIWKWQLTLLSPDFTVVNAL